MAIPEISYVAIKVVARFPVALPLVGGVATFLLLLASAWPVATTVTVATDLVIAALAAFALRLLVEIVIVLADTLLPR